MTEEGTLHPGGSFGLGGSEGGGVGGEGDKKAGLDELLSKEAVKIDGSLDQIFEDSEEEEEEEGLTVSFGLTH